MTHRTENRVFTPIEKATREVIEAIVGAATIAYETHEVERQHQTTESEFKRILALYFHDKTIADWCEDFGIPDASDPNDKPRRE